MSTSEAQSFAGDDRGAVMVLGIFMCSCLVGAMWYLAGLGDAILYHERMQEAADAVAFSDAALHARAMNLLVLLNLIMSVILAIRVAVRVAKLGCTIAAAVFAALAFVQPELAAFAAPAAAAAETLDQADSAMKPAVEAALRGLMVAQEGVRDAAPLAAYVDSLAIGDDYKPVVQKTAAFRPKDTIPTDDKLPVEKGSSDKLCDEAADSLGAILAWALDTATANVVHPVSGAIGDLVSGLAKTDETYFCDLSAGASPSPQATQDQMQKQALQECKDTSGIADGLHNNFYGVSPYVPPTSTSLGTGSLGSEKQWEDACLACHVTCTGFDPIKKQPDGRPLPLPNGVQTGTCQSVDPKINQAVLDADRLQRNEDLRSTVTWDNNGGGTVDCFSWAMKDMQDRKSEQEQQQKNEPAPAGSQPGDNGTSQGASSGDSIQPLRVEGFANNREDGIFIGAVLGDETLLSKDAKLVRLGAFKAKRTPQDDTSHAKLPAWAQAEMFYDCGDTWTKCDDNDDAMWHFQWKARLRRFNQPMDATMNHLSTELGFFQLPQKNPDAFADDMANDAPATKGSGSTNAALRRDLSNSIKKNGIRDQGVH